MKMRLIPVVYFGFTAMDRRFSSPMLPWIFSEIRKREYQEKLSLGVEDGCLQAYNQDFEVQFAHKLAQMTRFSQADSDPCTFLYLLRDDVEQLLYCYLFATYKQNDVNELYQQLKEHQSIARPTPTPPSNLTSLCVDISPSCSNFFEVLYIGKIKVWHKKVPDTFIDDALDKFKQHDLEKNRKKLARLKSDFDLRRGSVDLVSGPECLPVVGGVPRLQRSHSLLSDMAIKSPDVDRKVPTSISEDQETESEHGEEDRREALEKEKEELRKLSMDTPNSEELQDLERQLKQQALSADEHNRTMVLQVDRTDLRLISPDRKVILLHKQHKDVATCIQGVQHAEHFGFIAREPTTAGTMPTYIGFVFKCESASVASETVSAITQAFSNPASSNGHHQDVKVARPSITSCDHCPMVWFHRLCAEIETMSDRKQQAAIFRRIEQLDDEEQTLILTKFGGAETDSLREQNEFLMMLLRAHCEMKQGRHVHDTAENRSEFLNQYLGGGNTIFMKAKRSLSNSFDHLLKRRGSRDDFGLTTAKDLSLPVHTPISRESSPNAFHGDNQQQQHTSTSSSNDDAGSMRSRSSTWSSQDTGSVKDEKSLKSPMMDIFMKVGSNTPSQPATNILEAGTWRQAIFKRVMTPSPKTTSNTPAVKKTKEELHELWKKSIHQAILLVRMEKENARIRAKQEESAVKRIKLEYDEMRDKHGESLEVWDLILGRDARHKPDTPILRQAIKQGIPRGKRGDVWHYLAEQYCAALPPMDATKYPTYNTPYETLLKQLTSHQHAILIDLGRTFPNHAYYASPLGPGQLALFNLLKAYSLLDPEVGYCQGLSFVAGVLLLHMDEPSAFFLLRHLMYRRNLRAQYLPDMVGLQVKLYQLSRLLRDHLLDVYNHLDAYEVAPTLYAAPWLLTNFASQFPLGFVTRVFDLIFLENTDVIFRVILALLMQHRDAILACDSFEDIMTYLKTKLPQIERPQQLDAIMRRVYTLDIGKQLADYQVEYNVLQEEMQSITAQLETFAGVQAELRHAQEAQKTLGRQLELTLANVQRLEQTRSAQQGTINRLEMHNRSMEVTIGTLGQFLQQVVDAQPGMHLPGDVRRILEKLPAADKKSDKGNIFSNIFKAQTNPNRLMVKSLSTGRIAIREPNDAMLRANSLNINGGGSPLSSPSGRGKIKGAFFSDSHKDILHGMVDEGVSPDSGVGTPIAHRGIILDETEEDSLNNNNNHEPEGGSNGPPLSHSDISVTYNTRELKKVKSVREMLRPNGSGAGGPAAAPAAATMVE